MSEVETIERLKERIIQMTTIGYPLQENEVKDLLLEYLSRHYTMEDKRFLVLVCLLMERCLFLHLTNMGLNVFLWGDRNDVPDRG